MSDNNLETLLIDYVCDQLFPNYNINRDVLSNWQVDLVDSVQNPTVLTAIIEEEVVLGSVIDDELTLGHQDLTGFFQKFGQLNDDVYRDFKMIILEVVASVFTLHYYNKMYIMSNNLYSVIVDNFLKEAKTSTVEDLNPERNSIVKIMANSLVNLLELGCETEVLRKVVVNLVSCSSPTEKIILLEFCNRIFKTYPSHFKFQLFRSKVSNSIPIPFDDSKPSSSKLFTIQSWFKINRDLDFDSDDISVMTLFKMSNSSNAHVSKLKIQIINYNQFSVEIHNEVNDSKFQFSFNQILNNDSLCNQGFVHFAITFDKYSNLNLYIDGHYSESIPCPELNKNIDNWNKLYIGDDSDSHDPTSIKKDELLIRNLTILQTGLSAQWINLLYNLGLGYDWSFKEFSNENIYNLLNHLTFRGLTNVALKLKEITGNGNRNRRNSFRESLSHISPPKSNRPHRSDKHLANGLAMRNLVDKNSIANSLVSSKFTETDILFNINENDFIKHLEAPVSHSKFLSHDSESIHAAFYVIGGTQLILTLIESCVKDINMNQSDRGLILYKSLDLLFVLVNNNWRLSKEFDNINGYGILSILLTNDKMLNKSGTFKIKPEVRFLVDPNISEVMSLILLHMGYDALDPAHSIIINPNGYRFLVLNFEFFNDSTSFLLLMQQFCVFIIQSRYNEFNVMELTKMKLLKKFLHFLKSPSLLHLNSNNQELMDHFSFAMSSTIKFDISVDNIKAISYYIIYAFYSSPHDCNPKLGCLLLHTLTDTLCDPESSMKILKKFSRSITIHWILLLLNIKAVKDKAIDHKEVVICGIRLLSKLLKILGPNIIRKFFSVNRGLDILTHFLRDWWSSDEILCQIYLSAFGIDQKDLGENQQDLVSLNQIILLAEDANNTKFGRLMMPEFLSLLNNLVLSAVYTLSEKKGKVLSAPNSPISRDVKLDISLDAIHLISSYAQSIERGFNNLKPLNDFYLTKEWTDGVFELIGYLRLFITWEESDLVSNFKNCYERLIRIVANMFISRVFNGTNFFGICNSSNDFTKKLILDIIFPRIFNHVNDFINVSNFIFKEKEFLNQSIHALVYYNQEYISQNFLIQEADLTSYINCILSVLEVDQKTNSVRLLKAHLGGLLILKLQKVSAFANESSDQTDPEAPKQKEKRIENFKNTIKMFLERQITIFQDGILSIEQTADILTLLLGILFKNIKEIDAVHTEHLFNLLRTVHMMKQDQFDKILTFMTVDVDYSASEKVIGDFFDTLLTKNNEETLRAVSKFPTLKHIINTRFHALLSKGSESSKMRISNMVSITLNNGGTLGQSENIYIKSFERDCYQLKDQIINLELIKLNRVNQDHRENVYYFATAYNSLKTEMIRLIKEQETFSYTLDFIESHDRMRSRLVIEDQLSESEKLAYKIDIPIKKIDLAVDSHGNKKTMDQIGNVINSFGIDTLSLSTERASETGDSFEVISDLTDFPDQDHDGEGETEPENDTDLAYEDRNRKVLRSLYLGDHIVSLWNISQINGLAPVESLMILGSTHLYIIENYFHQADGNVIDVQDAPMELRDPYLQLINSQSSYYHNGNGTENGTGPGHARSHVSKNWSLETLSSISKRQFLLRDIALEMFFTDGASILLTCISSRERDSIYNKLYHHCAGKGLDQDLSQTLLLSSSLSISNNNSSASSFFTSKIASAFSTGSSDNFLAATKKWKNGEMSNFYYLMIINTLAGRTFNDLTQYPVFPWVIADYTSETLDLSDPKTFRDLSKPLGAQTEPRASQFRERFEALKSLEDDDSPAFHYGTHYSSAMIVTSFLIRLKPYVHSYLLLQGGKFDHADRLFNSIEKAWLSASRDNTTDVRELIPEFFYLPEFLSNDNDFELGVLQNGEVPNNVQLPKWAKGDPKLFVQKNREALESSHVSANLHSWIDLIFGYKQSGPAAEDALNIFHHLSYNGAINLDSINDEMERKAAIGMINNFGQTPNKIFHKPHPKKDVLNLPNYYLTSIDPSNEPKIVFESKLKRPIRKIEISSKSGKWVGRPDCVCSEDDLLIRKVGTIEDDSKSIIINNTSFLDIHRSPIKCILQIGYKMFLTASKDGLIHNWKCNTKPHLNLQFQGTLRGHYCEIKELKFSKNYKLGLSSDTEGNVIFWDFVRFKFIRKIHVAKEVIIDISNDSGNIAIVDTNTNTAHIFTLNGELIVSSSLSSKPITSIRFGSINDSRVETGKQMVANNHSYWSEEYLSVAYGGDTKSVDIYSIKPNTEKWDLVQLSTLPLKFPMVGDITAYELMKKIIVDPEDKLTRGYFSIIMGDCNGRVHQW